MKTVLIVLALGLAAVECGHRGRRGPHHHHHHGPPPPPFLRDLDRDAQEEYFEIMRKNETIAEQKKEVEEWATTYGVKDKLDEFNKNMTQHREEMKKNVTDLIAKLPEAFQKFSKIMESESQTRSEQREAMRKLTEEDPKLYHTLRHIFGEFMPRHGHHGTHHGRHDRRGMERRGGFGGFDRRE